MSRRRKRREPQPFMSLREIVVGAVTLVVAAVAFAPEIAQAITTTKEQLKMHETETIDRAAIFYNGTIYSVPRPGRHHNVIRMMARDGFPDEAMRLHNQGFVTNTGRFVDRCEAARIARAAKQLVREPTPPDMLTSEDVW